jgi:diguanylate cyclase (GGDEF)-like protein
MSAPAQDLPGQRWRLELQVLILQSGLAVFVCAGACAGLFAIGEPLRSAIVCGILGYHVLHAWYVVRFRRKRRYVRWVEFLTPMADVACITAVWVAVGDPQSNLWVIYFYALAGHSRRIHGWAYGLTSGFILANAAAGAVALSLMNGGSGFDANTATMLVLMAGMACLSAAIGSAWRDAESRARILAETDPLTGIANRRIFLHQLDALSPDRDEQFAILMLDLDDFKHLNDERGHLEGDRVLTVVARTLEANLRDGDRLARYGGEEFVVLLPGAGLGTAAGVAERLRSAVEASSPTSVSVGCAVRRGGEDSESVVRRADALLLAVKRTGKNAVLTDWELPRSA